MKETRDEIINLADEFIRTKGFNAFSYADIAGIMDIRKPALHYYFPSKSDLGISVIDKELGTMTRQKKEWAHLPGDIQFKKIVERFFNSSRGGRICLTGSLTPDYNTLSGPMQAKVRGMCQAIEDWMASCLEKGRTERRLHFQGEAKDRALLVMSGLLSSLLLSRVLGNAVFDRMVGQLLKDMNANFQVADLQDDDIEYLKEDKADLLQDDEDVESIQDDKDVEPLQDYEEFDPLLDKNKVVPIHFDEADNQKKPDRQL